MAVSPHGGRLIERVLAGEALAEARQQAAGLPRIVLAPERTSELENIACGVFSPLEGFLGEADFHSVLHRSRLADGTAWTIPIVLDVDGDTAAGLAPGQDAALADEEGRVRGLLHVTDKYRFDRTEMAEATFATSDDRHPGVARVMQMADWLVGGQIDLLERAPHPCDGHRLDPRETRLLFREKGWRTVGAFQTRNVPHAGHEYLQKVVLAITDGLMIQPVIGRKKPGDFKDEAILQAYDAIIAQYFVPERTVLNILLTEMRYAGPREAIHHAIMRQNYGCTHIVIGRDHAGVGKYYHPEAAIEIFRDFPDLQIQPLTIHGDFFHCFRCGQLASERTCPHPADEHIAFSGTEIRRLLGEGRTPPPQIMRPEVFAVLRTFDHPFVE